ncbi:B-lymphocyte antigen CD20 [Microtus ochrogaster]|uniref:B-lymphocyte antigen CD20 n=1 Tax=Microtus ochrogaster TaxID=79684 RepID=A0A8J6GLR2_MICOH|nr:B-lymphocyte antigen CD20 [Microtus ochrogaster]
MDSNNKNSPMFLVFPPEVTSPEQQTTLTASAYNAQNRVQKVLIRKLKVLGFINSGAFLIALKRKTTDYMIKMSQVMNLLSALGATAGIILLIFGFLLDGEFICGYSPDASQCAAITTLFILWVSVGLLKSNSESKVKGQCPLKKFEKRMTTPRNSVSGTFPIQSAKGPLAMQPTQTANLRRPSSLVGPTQRFFMRESKALGAVQIMTSTSDGLSSPPVLFFSPQAVQIMNGLFHISLGGLLMIPTGVFAPICLSVWYPLWGGIMVKAKVIMNSLSLFAATSGIILSIMDILNITVSHFLKMERLNLSKAPNLYVDIYNCEPANSSDKNSPSTRYCYSMQSVFLGILSVMLIFAFFQKLVTAGVVENDWKRVCSRSKPNVVLLAAGQKKEQTIKVKEEIIELSGVSPQLKNEEEIEIIPVQEEEEEETEVNFPEPPQEQESLPVENEISP